MGHRGASWDIIKEASIEIQFNYWIQEYMAGQQNSTSTLLRSEFVESRT